MAEYWAFLNTLRHDLGKRYTVAQERTSDAQHITLLVRRRRHDALLAITTDTRWLAQIMEEPGRDAHELYRQLAHYIKEFFAHSDLLPTQAFSWPGSPDQRDELGQRLSSQAPDERPPLDVG